MSLTAMLALVVCAPQGGGVVINEFQYDDSGTDDREFVEIYNASDAPVDLTGWVLDSEDDLGPNTAYPITAGTILAPGDYWVMGSALVPNVDQDVGATNLWENSNESLTLRDDNGRIIDTVVYESNKGIWTGAPIEGIGVWGNKSSIDGIETSWSRLRDGFDTDDNGRDFRLVPATPGASNDLADLTPYLQDFDAVMVGDTVPDWSGSFVAPLTIDPTVVDANNPNAIPASPQGGNAGVFWDPAGGGNYTMLVADAERDIVLEALVYFEATPQPAASGDYEVWSLGVQGTSASFFNSPDPADVIGGGSFTANGNTGITWTYQRTEGGGVLYLVDHNSGGWGAADPNPPTVLGSINITPGVNDGWQRVRLQVSDDAVEGRFGGTYGQNDGQNIAGTIQGEFGGIYASYREAVTDNSTARPLTMDGLRIEGAGSNLTVSGDGSPGGTLTFDLAGAPSDSLTLLLISPHRGNLSLRLGPLGLLELGLLPPIIPADIGRTDGMGDYSHRIQLPPFRIPETIVCAQALTIDFQLPRPGGPMRPSLSFVPSDVECFAIGGTSSN